MSTNFDRVASIYDATRGLPPDITDQVADGLIAVSNASPDGLFFEAGIGTGRIALPIASRGFEYIGVDVSARMLAELRAKNSDDAPVIGMPGDMTRLPFANASFDVALTCHVLHLVEDWRAALDEIRRILKRGGTYLYCEGGGSRWKSPVYEAWSAIAERHEVTVQRRHAKRASEVLAYLREHDAKISIQVLAEWNSDISVDEMVQRIATRTYSSHWNIPDDLFETMVAELREWAAENTKPGAILQHENSFTVTCARL